MRLKEKDTQLVTGLTGMVKGLVGRHSSPKQLERMITSTLGLEVIVYGTTKTNRVVETHAVTKIPLDGDWIHLTVTHDGKETVSFYINGKLEKSTNPLTAKGNDINVLVGDDGKGNKGAGILDELSIFNRALTAAEAKTIYEDGVEPFLAIAPEDKLTATWGCIKREATREILVN